MIFWEEMKLKKDPTEIKDCEMGTKSDLPNEDDSLDNASAASTNQSTVDSCQVNNVTAEQIFSISKEKASVKLEAIEMFLDGESIPQNINSKSGDYMEASTSKSNSSESQQFRMSSEENLPSYKENVLVKQEGVEGFLVNESVPQNAYSKSEDCIITSTSTSNSSESQEFRISSEGNIPYNKEKISVKQEDFERFLVKESLSQNLLSKFVKYMRESKSDSNSSESKECEIYSEESAVASKEERVTKLEESDISMADVSNPPNSDGSLLTRQMDSNESHQHEIPSKENTSAEIPSEVLIIEDSKSHRQNTHYSSDSSDYESDSSSSWDEFYDKLHKNLLPSQLPTLKTKGELLIQDLPPVEDLNINVNATELQKIGSVLHSVISEECNEYFVVVESDGNSNPIDADSVLFLSSDKPLGKVHDVFGSVSKPKYTVRFNKGEDICGKGVTAGQDVYYLPESNDLTHYVLVDVLKQQRGSDASWKDNNEPPDDQIDYSDDEQEKLAKQKRRAKNRRNDRNGNDGEGEGESPNKLERRHATYSRERTFVARPSRNHFRSPAPRVSGTSPRSYFFQNFGSTQPSANNLGLQRNAISPQPLRFISSNNNRPQSSMPAPQTFGPFSSRNATSPRPSPHSNAPSPHTFGPLQQSRMPPPVGTFPPSSVPSYQSFTVPPPSNVSSSPNYTLLHSASVQPNPSTLMAAPQSNVPLQQQILVQTQQPIASFLSHPPPNYHPNQNTGPFLHQIQSFAPPMFGAPPAIRPTMQNISNHPSVNQILIPFGSNCPTSLSGNLSISQPRNNMPTNFNGYQGQSSGLMQANPTNSFSFPQVSPLNTQHNNVYTQIAQPVFIPNQSPCPTPPFVPCQTPPPPIINQQQGFTVLCNSGPPVLPSQTPPPAIHQLAFTLPVARSPMPPQNFPFC